MKTMLAAVALTAMFGGSALAQNSGSSGSSSSGSSTSGTSAGSSTMKMSQTECTTLWQQAGGMGSGLTEAQAKPYVTDFKAANPDGDATIDQNEFMTACNKGLVKSSSSSGASTGTSGASGSSTHSPSSGSSGSSSGTSR